MHVDVVASAAADQRQPMEEPVRRGVGHRDSGMRGRGGRRDRLIALAAFYLCPCVGAALLPALPAAPVVS